MNNESKSKVVIIGAGGHGKVVADIVIRSGDMVVGFLDDDSTKREIAGWPVLGRVADFTKYSRDCRFIVAIGNADIREGIADMLNKAGVSWYTAIHPNAVISDIETSIGDGTVVMAGAIVNAGASIGEHCIINSNAVVEHDNQIGDFVHVSVGVLLGGSVSIARKNWIGIGAVIINNIGICEGNIIGAGAVVVEDVKNMGTYIGVPAKKRGTK